MNVAQLLKFPVGTARDLTFAEALPDPSEELQLAGPVRGHVRLMRTARGILASATFQAPTVLTCARCLGGVQAELEGSFEEEFLPSIDLRSGLPVQADEVKEDSDQQWIDEHHEIHFDELLRQGILMSLPLQPLCDATCPGLCPECGQRLDASHVAHEEETPAEPREPGGARRPFQGLAELLAERNRPSDRPPS